MNPIIIYRDDVDWRQEEGFAKKYFQCYSSRLKASKNDLVIARFSALPFYKEQEMDYQMLGAKMINSYNEHKYIADLGEWYEDLRDYTPFTWQRLEDLPEDGPFILKGETNSKKYDWNTSMFAKNKAAAIQVHSQLCKDSLISYQKIYIRKYIPLKRFMTSFQGLPITNEYRFFIYKDKILSGGYYWSSHILDLKESGIEPNIKDVPVEFLNKIINIVKERTNFYVIDVAETESGEWIVVELNDGQQSGLSENDPDEMYRNLQEAICAH